MGKSNHQTASYGGLRSLWSRGVFSRTLPRTTMSISIGCPSLRCGCLSRSVDVGLTEGVHEEICFFERAGSSSSSNFAGLLGGHRCNVPHFSVMLSIVTSSSDLFSMSSMKPGCWACCSEIQSSAASTLDAMSVCTFLARAPADGDPSEKVPFQTCTPLPPEPFTSYMALSACSRRRFGSCAVSGQQATPTLAVTFTGQLTKELSEIASLILSAVAVASRTL